jgi:hypothetical protein
MKAASKEAACFFLTPCTLDSTNDRQPPANSICSSVVS